MVWSSGFSVYGTWFRVKRFGIYGLGLEFRV
jgi:hypothetical protein